MEINKTELKIVNLFRRELFLELSIRQLMRRLKSNSYQRVYEAANLLIKKNILKFKKVGRTNQISLNFSRETILLFSFLDEQEAKKIPNHEKILGIKEISDFIILVSGSYAAGRHTKKSDLDMIIIIPDKEDTVSIQKLVENKTLLLKPEVHLYVFRKKDFTEMLLSKDENYAKEIAKKRIMLKNAQLFYELVKEAAEYGYKG
ncbi:MAG: nucleotidyltransferase domain-containing protein [Candidatus Aenigmatarchaeota archaeon]